MRRPAPKRVLVVSADAMACADLLDRLADAGCQISSVRTPDEAEGRLRERTTDAVVVATTGRTREGLALLDRLRQRRMRIPVIVVADVNDVDLYLEAMNCGAFDYLVQPLSDFDFFTTVRKALEWSPRRRRAA